MRPPRCGPYATDLANFDLRNVTTILSKSRRPAPRLLTGSARLAEGYSRKGSADRISVAAKSFPLNSKGRSRALASA